MKHVLTALILSVGAAQAAPPAQIDRPIWDPPERYQCDPSGWTTYYKLPPRQVAVQCPLLLKADKNIFIRYINMTREWKGCTYCDNGYCTVVYIDRPVYGTTPDAVKSHEDGHACGWDASHPD